MSGQVFAQYSKAKIDKGDWQEKIIWYVIMEFFDYVFGAGRLQPFQSVGIRQSMTWRHDACEIKVDWFKQRTHPEIVGSESNPDFTISVNRILFVGIESKNHKLDLKWSMVRFKKQVLTRFQNYRNTLPKLLIIGKFLPTKRGEAAIERSLNDEHIEVIEIGREATSSTDWIAYNEIKSQLEPELLQIVLWTIILNLRQKGVSWPFRIFSIMILEKRFKRDQQRSHSVTKL